MFDSYRMQNFGHTALKKEKSALTKYILMLIQCKCNFFFVLVSINMAIELFLLQIYFVITEKTNTLLFEHYECVLKQVLLEKA